MSGRSTMLPMFRLVKGRFPTRAYRLTPAHCGRAYTTTTCCKRFAVLNANTGTVLLKPAVGPCLAVNFRRYGSLPSHRKVPLPALSPTMERGNLVSWKKKEGDQISEGDLLCEIETDKATMGVEASDEGYLAKIVVQEGEKDVPVGNLLCIVVENADDVAPFANLSAQDLKTGEGPKAETAAAAAAAPPTPVVSAPPPSFAAAAPPPPPPPAPVVATPTGGRVMASPLAKKLAAQNRVEIGSVSGTGPGGRILAADLTGAQKTTAAVQPQVALGGSFTDVEVSNIRRTIAKRLTEAKINIPHYYLSVDVELDAMIKVRQRLNEMLEKEGKKVSLNDIIIKACALSCRAVPEVNSSWMDTYIRTYNYVDVSVAVMTQAGLMTPIVFNADSKGLLEISQEIAALGAKAKSGKLQPHEFQGGTFTVSNLGMFGVHRFSAIINPPQSAILAVGTTQNRVAMGDNGCVEKTYLTATISCDHRVVDGAVGARWLQKFKGFMEKPIAMLL